MNRLYVPALLTLALATPVAPAAAETRDLSGFTRVSASAGFDVDVAVGGGFQVDVTGPGANRVVTRVDGGTLIVEPTPGIHWGRRPPVRISVSMPRVDGLSSSSGADLTARGVNTESISLRASSGSDLNVEGTCGAVDADVSSGADIDARNLRCQRGSAEASSGADVYVNVSGELDVRASSGADVHVSGGASIGDVSLSSGGSLNRR
jgi:hypothetical protein